jgi:hypothetical protein
MYDSDEISLDHLDRMTDSTGLIQHAIYSIPRRESGYTTDDNARALRLCTCLWRQHPDQRMLNRIEGYLSFIEFARCGNGGFHNFLSYQRHWLDAQGTGDCQGQAVRCLAEVLGSSLPDDYRALARELIDGVLPTLADLRSLRAQAYVVLAWAHLWTAGVTDIEPLENVAWLAARRLVESYQRARRQDWPWFESRMTYANAVLPHALFLAARRWPKEDFLEVAEATFAFLDRETTEHGLFYPIGNNGWYTHGEDKARYDQQPVEAAMMADTALAAFDILGDEKYLATFHRAHAWFHGENNLRQPLVDVWCGACFDGLHPSGVNRNQGAESTLAYLSAEFLSFDVRQAHSIGRNDVVKSPVSPIIGFGR